MARAIYEFGRDIAEPRGIIVADTKFEFGCARRRAAADRRSAHAGHLALLAGRRLRAGSPAAQLRQAAAARLAGRRAPAGRWNGDAPAPTLPDEVDRRRRVLRYRDAFQRITGGAVDRVRYRVAFRSERQMMVLRAKAIRSLIGAATLAVTAFALALRLRSWPLWLAAFALTWCWRSARRGTSAR